LNALAPDRGSSKSRHCAPIDSFGWARRILIAISWLWLRYQLQTALAQWYGQRTRGQGQRVMLVALTRKLAVMLWRYVETGAAARGETVAASSMGFET
jgi:transposase